MKVRVVAFVEEEWKEREMPAGGEGDGVCCKEMLASERYVRCRR